MQNGHHRQIKRVAGAVVKGADAALTENDLLVAAGHDVFGAHEQLFGGAGHTALQKDGLAQLPHLAQEVKILHISGADLNDIHILKQRQIARCHDLGNDGQAGFPPGHFQKRQAVGLQALEIIGRGPGLKSAAAQQLRAGSLDRAGHRHDLLLAFHGAGAGDHAEMPAADLHAAHLHNGVIGVGPAAAALERLGNGLDRIHDIEAGHQIPVNVGGVTDQTQHGLIGAPGNMDLHALLFQPADQSAAFFFACVGF